MQDKTLDNNFLITHIEQLAKRVVKFESKVKSVTV